MYRKGSSLKHSLNNNSQFQLGQNSLCRRGLHINVLELVGVPECIESTVPDNSNLELNLDNNVVRYVLLRMVFNGI